MILRCRECNTPIAILDQGCLVIEAKHHGERHITTISVWDLVLMVLRQISGEAQSEERET